MTHYSRNQLARVTGENPRTLKYWYDRSFLVPTKVLLRQERFTLEAYEKAVALSAQERTQKAPVLKLRPQATVFSALRREFL